MAKKAKSAGAGEAKGSVRIHPFQRLLDNPFALLFIGVATPAVFYIVWGIMEITGIPLAQ